MRAVPAAALAFAFGAGNAAAQGATKRIADGVGAVPDLSRPEYIAGVLWSFTMGF